MTTFAQCAKADVAKLIASYPLAWIVPHADPAAATPMPVLLERYTEGARECLLGHLPRRAPVTEAIRTNAVVTFLFTGPHRYVDPAWLSRSDWAPTWNFAVIRVTGTVLLDTDVTRYAVEQLVMHLEGAEGWKPKNLGDRYEALLSRVIGFRAHDLRISPRMKLGQDEGDSEFAAIVDALDDDPLALWMKSFKK